MQTMPDESPPPLAITQEWDGELPFFVGRSGTGVADLQARLERLGYCVENDPPGSFGNGTQRAVRAFQDDRGLRCDGVCGINTWASLVEAGFRLGDRLLYRRSPMLHGDDVAELQERLSALGFDPGRVDGIFGDQTASALADFQHNIGLLGDGICGPLTLGELARLSPRRGGEDLVSGVREQLRLSGGAGTLRGRVIVVGEPGGFQSGAAAVGRALAAAGAEPLTLHQPDESVQADNANVAGADCFIGLQLEPERHGVRAVYYRGYRYESEPSRHLAELVAPRAAAALGLEDEGTAGMALTILRRTRMPAVLLELGSPSMVAMQTARLAAAVTDALVDWAGKDWR